MATAKELNDAFDKLAITVRRIKKEHSEMVDLLRGELESLDDWLRDDTISDRTLGEMLNREDEIQMLLNRIEAAQ